MTARRLILALGALIGACATATASPIPRSVLFSRAFGPDLTVTADDGATHLSGLEIGRLGVPSGRIVACDPFLCDGAYPSSFGLDKAGRAVALVTDFGVVEWRAGK